MAREQESMPRVPRAAWVCPQSGAPYVVCGDGTVWMYDSASNFWEARAAIPGSARDHALQREHRPAPSATELLSSRGTPMRLMRKARTRPHDVLD